MQSRNSVRKPLKTKKKATKTPELKRKVKKTLPVKPAAKKTVTKKLSPVRSVSSKVSSRQKTIKAKKPARLKEFTRPVKTPIDKPAAKALENETLSMAGEAGEQVNKVNGEQVNSTKNNEGQITQENEHAITTQKDPLRSFDQGTFNKLTAKGDPHQHLQLSTRRKGTIRPVGKKPLWNK